MKLLICLFIVLLPMKHIFASHIFHLEQKEGKCQWSLYDVKKEKDKKYYQTDVCPNQIVWLKDKSFYYSVKSTIYWANQWTKKPVKIVDYKSARKGHTAGSEVIWGVKGKYNSIYTMVIDHKIKHMAVNGQHSYEYNGKAINADSFEGDATEQKAAGIIKRWYKNSKKWKTISYKLTGRHSTGHDEDLFNMSVLSSKQIIHYNECKDSNCEKLPSESSRKIASWEKQLKLIDDGIESLGYMKLAEGKGILFKKSFDETQHPSRPFMLCTEGCDEMQEVELPKSFSNNFALVKKGNHFLVLNENKGSIGSLYSFNSTTPIKTFKGPMVFWHPF